LPAVDALLPIVEIVILLFFSTTEVILGLPDFFSEKLASFGCGSTLDFYPLYR